MISDLPAMPRAEFCNMAVNERLAAIGMNATCVSFHCMKDGRVYIGPQTDRSLDELKQIDEAIKLLINSEQ